MSRHGPSCDGTMRGRAFGTRRSGVTAIDPECSPPGPSRGSSQAVRPLPSAITSRHAPTRSRRPGGTR